MTFNIRYDNPGDGVNAWPNRKDKVFELLKKYDPDIIGIQEALQHQITDIIAALPEYNYTGTGRDDGKNKGEYSAILYKKNKFDISNEETSWLSKTPSVAGSKDWDAAITRVVTMAEFRLKGQTRPFYVINTHFDHIGKEARKESALILRKKANQLSSTPIIITGDFNCTREEPPYKVITEGKGIALHDAAPENAPGTFCSFEVGSMACSPIDYIFHSSQWKSSDFKVITDNDGKYYPSDHLPVIVSLSIQ